MKNNVLVTVVIILVVIFIGVLGYFVWGKFVSKDDTPQSTTGTNQSTSVTCTTPEGSIEKDGVVCSEEIGIKFKTPTIFEGKFEKIDNYEVFKGGTDPRIRTSVGESNVVYEAAISGTDNFKLTIAKEPLRTGYVNVGHQLQNTFYDTDTGLLSNVNTPTDDDSSFTVGDTVPSFDVNGVKFYHGSVGDAGARIETYFAVIDGSIVRIMLSYTGYMGPEENNPSTIDADQVFNDLDAAVKNLTLIRK